MIRLNEESNNFTGSKKIEAEGGKKEHKNNFFGLHNGCI